MGLPLTGANLGRAPIASFPRAFDIAGDGPRAFLQVGRALLPSISRIPRDISDIDRDPRREKAMTNRPHIWKKIPRLRRTRAYTMPRTRPRVLPNPKKADFKIGASLNEFRKV